MELREIREEQREQRGRLGSIERSFSYTSREMAEDEPAVSIACTTASTASSGGSISSRRNERRGGRKPAVRAADGRRRVTPPLHPPYELTRTEANDPNTLPSPRAPSAHELVPRGKWGSREDRPSLAPCSCQSLPLARTGEQALDSRFRAGLSAENFAAEKVKELAPRFVLAGLGPAIHALQRRNQRRGYAGQARARRLHGV